MEYKKKYKLKLKSLPKPKVSKEYSESMKMTSPKSDKVTPAKTEGPKLVIKPKKEGKIIYRKGGNSKMTEMDAKAMTDYAGKDVLEKARYKLRKKEKKMIEGLK